MEDYTVPIVAMNVAFRGGAAQDPDGKAGLANLMSGLLDEGAGDLDSRAFQAKLEDLSVELSFDAGSDAFYGSLRTLSTNLDEAFDLFRLAITEPRFDAEPVERIRGQIAAGLRQDESDPDERRRAGFSRRRSSATHPYGRATDGTVESVATITADDLKAFHARTMARDNLYVVLVGAIDAKAAGAALDRMFGALPAHARADRRSRTWRRRPARPSTPSLSVPQTAIRIGGPGLKRDDPDFITAYVANEILGGGTFSSRLYKSVREDRGLAYSVGSASSPTTMPAPSSPRPRSTLRRPTRRSRSCATRSSATPPKARRRRSSPPPRTTSSATSRCASIPRRRSRAISSASSSTTSGSTISSAATTLIRAVTLEDIRRVAQRLWSGAAVGRHRRPGPGVT